MARNVVTPYITAARSRSQVAAPGQRTRGMVQNAALSSAIANPDEEEAYARATAPQPQYAEGIRPTPDDLDWQVHQPEQPVQPPPQVTPPAPSYAQPGQPDGVNTSQPGGVVTPVGTAPSVSADTRVTPPSAMPQGGRWGANYEWEGPEAAGLQAGNAGNMLGFNTAGWGTDERGTNSLKNTFGKLASNFPATPSGLQALANDERFRQFFPNAQLVGFDKIDFGDGNAVDVLVGADPNSDTAQGWAFQTGAPAGASGAGTAGASPAGAGYGSNVNTFIGGGDDRVEQFIQYLMSQLAMGNALGS